MKELVAVKQRLIQKARECQCVGGVGGKPIESCFTMYRNHVYLWFDTADESTHAISEELA